MGQVCEHARGASGSVVYPARDGNQLLVLVCSRVCVRIYHSQAQLRMVEQVQLRYGCRFGLWSVYYATPHREEVWVLTNIWVVNRHCAVPTDYFLRAPVAQRWYSSQLVGQYCLHEQCVSSFFIACPLADLSGMYRCRLRRYTFNHDVARPSAP